MTPGKEPTRIQRSLIFLSVVLGIAGIFAPPAAVAFRAPDDESETAPHTTPRDHTHPQLTLPIAFAQKTTVNSKQGGAVHRTGLTGELTGLPRTQDEVVSAVLQYLREHADRLAGVGPEQLQLAQAATIPAKGTRPAVVSVQLVQQRDGVDIEGSYVHVSVKLLPGRSVITSGSATVFPALILPAAAAQVPTDEQSRVKAAEALQLDPTQVTLQSTHRKVRFAHGQWRRVKEVQLNENDLTTVIDETTGDSWVEDHRIYAKTIEGLVHGKGVQFNPSATPTLDLLTLKNLLVTASDGRKNYTDATGHFTLPTSTTLTTVNATLQGHWANVHAIVGEDLKLSTNVQVGVPADLTFNASDPTQYTTSQVNGYYHTDFIHDWVQARLPKLSLPTLDVALPVNVNHLETCNAFYNPFNPSINFFRASSRCLNTAMDTIIYHEYGHFIDDMAGRDPVTGRSGITDRGLSEGWGDVMATFATQQPLIGEGVFTDQTPIRSADNTYQYAPAGWPEEVHRLGQAWSGFAWDLRKSFMTSYGTTAGAAMAEELVIPTILANSSDIPDAVADTLTLDDEDGNLMNGTPHFNDILQAAIGHGIPVPPYVHLSSPEPDNVLPLQTGDVSLRGTVNGPGFERYDVFYGAGAFPSTWTPINTATGTTPVQDGSLGTWSIAGLDEGLYTLRLVTTLQNQFQVHDQVLVELTQTPPEAVAPNPSGQTSPAISGDLVVWVDDRNKNLDLYVADLSGSSASGAQPIITTTRQQEAPVIDGNRIVWEEYITFNFTTFSGNRNIYSCVYNAATHTCPVETIASGPSDQSSPAISGNRVVYLGVNKFLQVYLYDLTTHTAHALTTNMGNHFNPHISGDLVVWEEYRNDKSSIYLYDLAAPPAAAEQLIAASDQDLVEVAIANNRIVWVETDAQYHPRTIVSCVYDRTTHQCPAEPITDDTAIRVHPAVSSRWIAWQDYRNGNPDIYVYDVVAHKERPVTTNPMGQYLPAVSDTRVVWVDTRDGFPNLYTAELNVNKPPVLSPIGNHTLLLGLPFTMKITATDPDGEALTYAASGLPTGAAFNPSTRVFSWTPTLTQTGTYSVTFTVRNAGGLQDSETVTLTAKSLSLTGRVMTVSGNAPGDVEVRLGPILQTPTHQPFEAMTDTQSGLYSFSQLQTAPKLHDAILKCRTTGLCAPVRVGVHPMPFPGWRIRSVVNSQLPYQMVTFDPANPDDIVGVDFKAGPR